MISKSLPKDKLAIHNLTQPFRMTYKIQWAKTIRKSLWKRTIIKKTTSKIHPANLKHRSTSSRLIETVLSQRKTIH